MLQSTQGPANISARRGSSWPSQTETRHGAESKIESILWILISDAADMNVGEGLSGVLEGPFFQERQSKKRLPGGCLSPCPIAQLGLSPATSLIPYPGSCIPQELMQLLPWSGSRAHNGSTLEEGQWAQATVSEGRTLASGRQLLKAFTGVPRDSRANVRGQASKKK